MDGPPRDRAASGRCASRRTVKARGRDRRSRLARLPGRRRGDGGLEYVGWTLRASYVADAHNVNSLAISPDSRTIAASCHRSGVVKLWDMPAASRPGKGGPRGRVSVTSSRTQIATRFARREAAQARLGEIGAAAREALQRVVKSGTPEQRIRAQRLLRPITGGDIRPKAVPRFGGDMQAVAFSPDGALLAVGSMVPKPGDVLLSSPGRAAGPIVVPVRNGAWDIAFSPDGKLLATGSADGIGDAVRGRLDRG